MAVTTTGGTREAVIFDDEGKPVRGGIGPTSFWSIKTAFAGQHSFFTADRYPGSDRIALFD